MLTISMTDDMSKEDSLHIAANPKIKKVNAHVTALRFVDKDTKQYVIYIPAFEISGYGDTSDAAWHMLEETVDNFFDYLTTLPNKQLKEELARLGWKKHFLRNKDFSAPVVNIESKKKQLNAVDDKIEKLALVA